MIVFKNRFPQLARFNDRICDSDYHPDYDPTDKETLKYEVFLCSGWTWDKPIHYADCLRTESFKTLSDAKYALRHAVKMDFNSEPCSSCPHLVNGHCVA